MQGVERDSTFFLTCPKNMVTAYELAPVYSKKVLSAVTWTMWWTNATSQ
jgi:hypothetical protein